MAQSEIPTTHLFEASCPHKMKALFPYPGQNGTNSKGYKKIDIWLTEPWYP